MEAAIAENILAGVPMRRRAAFQFGSTLAPGPRSHIDSGLGKAIGRGTTSLIAPNQLITQAVERHTHRRRRHRLPADAGDRGAGGDELPLPAVQGAEPGGERLPHDAQPVPDPRRQDARCAGLVEVPGRGAERLHRRHRCRHRPAPLAHLGPRARAQVHHRAARPVPAAARPDAAADEPRPDAARDRAGLPPAGLAGEELARAARTTAPSRTTCARCTRTTWAPTTATR